MEHAAIFGNVDLLSLICEFAFNEEYLFAATVNRTWLEVCGTDSKKTMLAACFETLSRLKESVAASPHSFISQKSLPEYVITCGRIEVMQHALRINLVNNLTGSLEHAIRCNNTALIADLTDLNTKSDFGEARIGPACLIAAVESGSLALVREYCADGVLDYRARNFGLEDNYFYPFDSTAKKTICGGWKTYVGDYLIEAAKREGHFEILRWLHAQNIPSADELAENHDIIGEAAAHGNREMVEWMLHEGYHPSACEIPYACHSNDVGYLDWLIKKGCIVDPDSLDHCLNTDPAVIAWLQSQGFLLRKLCKP